MQTGLKSEIFEEKKARLASKLFVKMFSSKLCPNYTLKILSHVQNKAKFEQILGRNVLQLLSILIFCIKSASEISMIYSANLTLLQYCA